MKKLLTLIISLICLAGPIYSQEETPPASPPDWNTLLKTNSIELIDWAKQTAQKTGDFAAEQTPLFIQEYVSWIFWSNLVTVLIFVVILLTLGILSVVFIIKENNKATKAWDGSFDMAVAIISTIAFTICLAGPFPAFGFPALKESIKAKVAPRVIIVEKISELVKK